MSTIKPSSGVTGDHTAGESGAHHRRRRTRSPRPQTTKRDRYGSQPRIVATDMMLNLRLITHVAARQRERVADPGRPPHQSVEAGSAICTPDASHGPTTHKLGRLSSSRSITGRLCFVGRVMRREGDTA